MILALQDDTSRHDAGRSLYGRSKARLPTGPASWPTRRGTSPIMVLTARSGRWLLPTSWPAWRAYNVCLPDTCRGYRWTAPDQRPRRPDRHPVRAPLRHAVGAFASRDGLWLRHDLLAKAARLAASGRVGETPARAARPPGAA